MLVNPEYKTKTVIDKNRIFNKSEMLKNKRDLIMNEDIRDN